MSSTPIIGVAVLIFCVAALLYYQSTITEHFTSSSAEVNKMLNSWSTWNSNNLPIAGRAYDPNKSFEDKYAVPPDLNRAPISKPGAYPPGALPTTSSNKPQTAPGAPQNMLRQTMATTKDLSELDSKIMTWLAAASQRENERPGSLTPEQQERRIILQARVEDIRQQLGLNKISDSYRTVADEIMYLRKENAGWQHQAPFVSAAFSFGKDVNPDALLTKIQYDQFFGILGDGIKQYADLYQPDPLQKVRYQQLQIIRQNLIDSSSPTNPPPIRMGAAQLFLRQMQRPEQPLPTLYSINAPGLSNQSGPLLPSEPSFQTAQQQGLPDDVRDYIRNIQWELKMRYSPDELDMKRAAGALMDRLSVGPIEPAAARRYIVKMDTLRQPAPFGTIIPVSRAPVPMGQTNDLISNFVDMPSCMSDSKLIRGANQLCHRIRKAFPNDVEALGCAPVTTKYEAETVINSVCSRLDSSVPTVTSEQFNCPALKQLMKTDG
jgi:hypothetical protein